MRLLSIALVLVACSDDPRRPGSDSGPGADSGCTPGVPCGMDSGPAACTVAEYTAQAEAICNVNHPEPNPRQLGATCVNDDQCDSGLCADRFTGRQYCSIACPMGTECPVGYRCDESGRIDAVETLCFEEVCVYGGTDRADCISNFLDDVEAACAVEATCTTELDTWVACLSAAGRQCLPGDACVSEWDAVQRCCPFCSRDRW